VAQARKFVDFLLSAENEAALARSKARQIPLGSGVAEASLPAEVRELSALVPIATPLAGLLQARTECLAWLKSEYTE
jgi:ABC-type Fe3+ transport system substrate-binding protein